MAIKTRIEKLENAAGKGARYGYLCMTIEGKPHDRDKEKGYRIQPLTVAAGGTGGEDFFIATRDEVIAFGNQPDVDLHILNISCEGDTVNGMPVDALT